MDNRRTAARYEETVLAHLDAAYNYARRLTGSATEAEDIVQEAALRALRFFESFRGGNGRAWFLSIVRNTYYTAAQKRRDGIRTVPLEDDEAVVDTASVDRTEAFAAQDHARVLVNRALDALPVEYREVIILRELEDLAYKEIAHVVDIPIGTVMSRLARGRKLLLSTLQKMREE